MLFLKTHCFGESTSISFIDSTPITVCKNKRNRVFRGIAATGNSTVGYFHGFKLQVNDKGELLGVMVIHGIADGRKPLKNQPFVNSLRGKLFADKGSISHTLDQVVFPDT